ncbi:metallophosphoesterase [Halomonas caseinilytica]|uniref:Icc protein n=1 Tax=Halomonas caseinilytica TaxID=438744 RepID=A0A1M6RV81_9GAMM|nr:metallophosphoesterase [Halomonas caseinilytica]SHK36411.1 Icc protein [Halomonas caseinilytica]
MRLVQISDCHLHADPAARSRTGVPHRQLVRVVEAVASWRPDMVLVTGDVSQDETAASYALARRELDRIDCPWFWLPGNHDEPVLMAECRAFQESVDLGQRRLLLLDTRIPGQTHGALGATRLEALAERLAEDDRPTLIAMHHPPISVGSRWVDALGLADAEAFWDLLATHQRIEAILCGHIHQAFEHRRTTPHGEVSIYACPATSDQFLPGAETFAVDEAAWPGFRVLELGSDLSTQVVRVEP